MDLVEAAYQVTKAFPKDEQFGLTTQIRRAATSVAANIAEGHGREQTGYFIRSLRIAQGSLKELETHLLIAQRAKIAGEEMNELTSQCDTIGKVIRALIRSLQDKERQ